MEIVHEISKSAFVAVNNGEEAGILTYTTSDANLIINHTEVYTGFEGQGIGKELVKQAVAYAKVNGLNVIAHCSYAKSVIEKDPNLQNETIAETE